MKKVVLAVSALALVLAATPWATAATLMGELSKIDEKGSFYILKDSHGKETRIHFDKTTQKMGKIAVGSRVQIEEDNGHAKSVKAVDPSK